MFEEMLKVAGWLDGTKVSVSVGGEMDQDGNIDRQCQAVGCEFSLKVPANDWRNKVSDEAVHGAICGNAVEKIANDRGMNGAVR